METKILIVDDDPDIRRVLRLLLSKRGYETLQASSGAEALGILRSNPVLDLVLLDVMMPGEDGVAVCRRMREQSQVPVLFLTAKTQEADMAAAYAVGGDDFLGKPFSPTELLMKVEALLRRYRVYRGKPESGSGLAITRDGVTKNGAQIDLTDKEAQILQLLYENRGEVLETHCIYESVWHEKFLPSSTNTVMVHMLHLRKKLEDDPAHPIHLRTVWGRGYQFVD